MKIKLLKKARKRFTITHYPNGITLHGNLYKVNVMKLSDNDNSFYTEEYVQINQPDPKIERKFCDRKADSKEEAINIFKDKIVQILKDQYLSLGRKRNSVKSNKVWYLINK